MSGDLRLGPQMWAVTDIETSAEWFRDVVGADVGEVHHVAHGNFERCFVTVGSGQIQLMQPCDGEETLRAFLERRGDGYYGQVYLTDDLDAARDRLVDRGLQVVAPDIDLGDMREAVLHPRSTLGVLTVLRQLVASEPVA